MLYDRAATEADLPRYLLLYGDGAWDNRLRCAEWSGYDADDLLLCFESDNSFSSVNCFVSDDFFCLLDDEEVIQEGSAFLGKPDVAVGRYPVRTLEEATVMADKTIGYAANDHAGAWQNVLLAKRALLHGRRRQPQYPHADCRQGGHDGGNQLSWLSAEENLLGCLYANFLIDGLQLS